MVREILLLGDPRLYERSMPADKEELPLIEHIIDDLHDTLMDFRARYQAGRAIAAPQIGVPKRILYRNTGSPVAMINPELTFLGEETMEVLDDCMSFPGLMVKVLRSKSCVVRYLDLAWEPHEMRAEGDLAELLQHEYDHLDGILATMRAADNRAFVMRKQ